MVVGGAVTRRGQRRQWLQDKQLAAYVDLLGHYARFTMTLSRAHADHSGWDYDWGAWSASLVEASLVAPLPVATELDTFGRAVNTFLDRVARGPHGDPRKQPLTAAEFAEAGTQAAQAQVALVNAIRRTMPSGHGTLTFGLGGSLSRP